MPRIHNDNRKELYENTDMSLSEIAQACGVTEAAINCWQFRNYSKEYRSARKRPAYSRSKQGDKNPMYGKCREEHHNYKDRVSDGKGYYLVLKPDWYTGRTGSKHVFEHHVVYCEHNGLTEIDTSKYCVHHIDEDKTNNHIDNLLMLTYSDHSKLHQNISNKESKI